jgi:hypothetical protein
MKLLGGRVKEAIVEKVVYLLRGRYRGEYFRSNYFGSIISVL